MNIQRPEGFHSTLALLYLVCVIEGADLQLLPASFKALERTLDLAPRHLATLGLAQSIVQFTSGLLWGTLADHGWSRKKLLVGGAATWSVMTFLLAIITNFPSMIALRMVNGAALGILTPTSQSLISDMTHPYERGFFFGWTQMALNAGLVMSALFAASISNMTIQGFEGWRVAFTVVAIASMILAFTLAFFMTEPKRADDSVRMLSVSGSLRKMMQYMSIASFRVIVLQGAFGSIPWSALSFAILYFQSIGIGDFKSSLLYSSSIAGGAFGGVLGGIIGDRLTRWNRYHGRPLTAQISVACGIPMVALCFGYVPRTPESYWTFASLLITFGLTASWCSAGVNRPILSELVGERDRSTIFAWVIALDGAIAALCGAPVVGYLADEYFGYEPSKLLVEEMTERQRQANATALANGMLLCTVAPWCICFVFYSFLHLTYGPDLEAASEVHDLSKKHLTASEDSKKLASA